MKNRIMLIFLLLFFFALPSDVVLPQDKAPDIAPAVINNNNDADKTADKPAEKIDEKPEKKKITKKIKVKYKDVNVAMGVRKEIYLDFTVGTVRPPTNSAVFKYEINKKADNPKLEKDRIVITGTQAGITDLWVYDSDEVLRTVYNVTVTQQNLKRILGFLKREFKNIEGLKMYTRERRIVLDGEILLPEDIARIHQVIGGGDYQDNVFKVQYRLSPTLFKVVAEKMEKEIDIPTVQVEVVNQRFVLKGEVKSDKELEYVVYKASLYLPKYFYTPLPGDPSGSGEMTQPAEEFRNKPIIDFFVKVVEPDKPVNKVIKATVYFVEIAKGFEEAFGFSWAPSIDTTKTNATLTWSNPAANDNGVETPPLATTITGVINSFIPKLQNAVKNNRGRVIQSSAITIENEKSGTVSKMTSYPYIVKTDNAITTQTANVGIKVELTPKILGNDPQVSDDINLQINIEVSQVVGHTEGVSIPITSSDIVNTVINLKSNETAAIGGIVQNQISKSYGDGSSDPNVIISLSRSKSFNKGKSQFVVFITPTILKSASEGSDSVKEKFRVK
ncbi:MAG: hypothetical protein V1647_05655 [Pseudomonadota bacterium]